MALLDLEKLRKDINILFGYVKCLMAKEDETSPLVATEWSANHSTATGNPYIAGSYVFWNGHVYKCLYNNDGLPPTNTTYWLDLGEGHLLAEEQSDWNATGGRRYILNKPTNTSDFVNNGEDGSSPYVTQDELNNAIQAPQDLDSVLGEGDEAPTRGAYIKEVGFWDSFAAPFGYAKIYADKSKIWLKSKLGNDMFSFSESGWTFLKSPWSYTFNFQNITGNRTATWQNKSGVVAYLSDITGATTEVDPVFTAWLATNPLSPYFLTPTGSISQYVRGDGSLATFPTMPVGIPAGGTTGQILTKVDSTDYNATWQENYADWTSVVKHTVKNDGTGLITKGTPVYSTGADGTNILVGKASNTSEATSSKTMGLMQSDITTTGGTQTGFVITEGLLGGLNTAGTTAGDPVWLGPTGTLIYGLINKPYAPAHLVFIGIVTKVSAGSGEIFVKVQNGFELKEIHDLDLITTPPSNNDFLTYDTATGLWKNKSWSSIFGYTPYRYLDATVVTYLGSVIGLTETIVNQKEIIGGSFNITDVMKVLYKFSKVTTVSGITIRIRINTTNTLVGATQVALYSMAAANTYALLTRTFNLSAGTLYGYNFASSTSSDMLAGNTVGSTTSYNTTNNLFVFFTIQLGNVADSAVFQFANITN